MVQQAKPEHLEHHDRPRAASFRELGRAFVDRIVARALRQPRAFKERLLWGPRLLMARLSAALSSLGPVSK